MTAALAATMARSANRHKRQVKGRIAIRRERITLASWGVKGAVNSCYTKRIKSGHSSSINDSTWVVMVEWLQCFIDS